MAENNQAVEDQIVNLSINDNPGDNQPPANTANDPPNPGDNQPPANTANDTPVDQSGRSNPPSQTNDPPAVTPVAASTVVEESKSDDHYRHLNPRPHALEEDVRRKLTLTLNEILDNRKEDQPLPEWGIKIMESLASIAPSSNKSSVSAVEVGSTGGVPPKVTFADVVAAQKTVTLGQSDVKRVPRLKSSPEIGDSDIDVQAILNAYHTVARFKAFSVRPGDEEYADQVAFEFLSLICDGHAATMLQQLMSGCINWQADAISTETTDSAGSFTPPSNWKELSNAILDMLMPSNSVENCAKQIAAFKQEPNETITAYATRYRSLLTRFESAVKRASKDRSPWAAYYVVNWEAGLLPDIHKQQMSEKPVTSFREAIDRARRIEGSVVTNDNKATVSATSFKRVSRRPTSEQFQGNRGSRQERRRSNTSVNPRTSRRNFSSSPPAKQHRPKGKNQQSNRPYCTYPGCKSASRVGHTDQQCYDKQDADLSDEEKAKRKKERRRQRSTTGKRQKKSFVSAVSAREDTASSSGSRETSDD